jgi:hypothetical protein
MMRFLVTRAVNPQLSLLDGLRNLNGIAAALREPPRKRRRYQGDDLERFLSQRLCPPRHAASR